MKINEVVRETIVLVMPFPVVCGMSHNSSRFESYGLTKLENPHMLA
jgi:hypothetical protein